MKKLARAVMLAAMTVSAATAAQAADSGKRGGFLAQMDMDFGGDDVATVFFEDGDDQDVKAGQGIDMGIGGWFRPVASAPFEIQALVGYKMVFTAASNADIMMTRTTLKLNGVYRFPNAWYVGAGYVQHMNTKLDGDGFFDDFEFDDANGFSCEVGWKWVALQYTSIKYPTLPGFEDVDGSNVGIRLTYRFGL
jgi:hypothetical protein